jgi:hypothetical protein
VPHTRGFFVLAPSGVGKTHYIKLQKEKNWMDGDDLWLQTGAQPPIETKWWDQGLEVIKEVESRSDQVTKIGKTYGLWILGASANWLIPDAIVLPPIELHLERIKFREENNYDGGLKSEHLPQLMAHRKEMEELAVREGVPVFSSVDEAADYIEDLYRKSA